MRLLFVAQESTPGDQVGPRHALERMRANGEISDLSIVAMLWEVQQKGSAQAALNALKDLAESMDPDVILWQGIGNLPVGREYLAGLKGPEHSRFLAYQEGDAWGGFHKPPTPAMQALACEADVVFVSGLGRMAQLFRHAGARRVRYCSSWTDTARFGTAWSPPLERRFDVVMIGNLISSRIPFHSGFPGAARRREAAEKLGQALGDRFALYGNGWARSPYFRGPIAYDQQEATNRQAWVTAGWDHYDRTPYYFSDRLPIALLSGVPHVSNDQPGYRHVFPPDAGVFFAGTPDDMVDVVLHILSRPQEERIEYGAKANRFAREKLTAEVLFGEMVRAVLREAHAARPRVPCLSES